MQKCFKTGGWFFIFIYFYFYFYFIYLFIYLFIFFIFNFERFNVVRLGVMWPGVMPTSGTVNATYLQVMRGIVDMLGARGIYTIVDLHQDVFSRKFCGEGAPDWLVEPD